MRAPLPWGVRGRLVALNQLNIVAGILIAFLSNFLIARALPADVAWRWMLGVAGLTFLEPLPVALVLTLVSAGVLSRRRKDEEDVTATSGARVLT